jgi:AraC-like DNA-binding protein
MRKSLGPPMSTHHDSSSRSLARTSRDDAAGALRGAADPLSDVLRCVQLTGALYFVWEITPPHATPIPDGRVFAPILVPGAQQIISYHVVTRGSCWASVRGASPVELQVGDILLIPHGDAYVLASSARRCAEAAPAVDATLEFFRQMAAGDLPFTVTEGEGGDAATQLICGFLGCDARPFNPVLAALPPLVHMRPPADPATDRVHALIDYTLAEARRPTPGGHTVLVRVSELMFIELMRRYVAEAPPLETGWLMALRDPVVGRALMLLHRTPAAPWTLEALAGQVGVSRTRLAESFSRFVGEPPIQYLARWRLQLATQMLATGSAKVAAVARDVGYDSEAAFSRAFKRFAGIPPSLWRARRHELPASHNGSRTVSRRAG